MSVCERAKQFTSIDQRQLREQAEMMTRGLAIKDGRAFDQDTHDGTMGQINDGLIDRYVGDALSNLRLDDTMEGTLELFILFPL